MTAPGRRRRLLPHERRGRDAGLLRRRLRGLPRAAARPAAAHGGASSTTVVAPARREPLAVPPARDLRRVDHALPRRVRGGQPRGPFNGLRWFFDHAETISRRATSSASRRSAAASRSSTAWRTRASTSSIATAREAAAHAPPIRAHARRRACRSAPAPTRPASPATTRGSRSYWLVTGKTVGGTVALPRGEPARSHGGAAPLHRRAARGSPARRTKKGAIAPGQLADLAVLSADYFSRAGGGDPAHRVGADDRRRQGRVRRPASSRRSRRRRRRPARAGRPSAQYGGWGAPGFARLARGGGARPAERATRTYTRTAASPLWAGIGCDCFAI